MSRQPTRSRIKAFLPVEPQQSIAELSQENVKADGRKAATNDNSRASGGDFFLPESSTSSRTAERF